MTNEIILQNLRDFTVQIRRTNDEAIVGTGIAVSLEGEIVTCAHVVTAALGVHPRQANGAEIGVYFAQARGDEEKSRRATVAATFPDHDDDVVILQLDRPPPLGPEQMPKIGTAEPSAFHPFRSYGYRRLDKYLAGHAHGTILDIVEPPVAAALQADPLQVESKQINQGMSGAVVLDTERNLVVGIIIRGVFHAEHLRRVGKAGYARRVTDANLEICKRNRWPNTISMCHRVLGELDAAEGQNESARTHFGTALNIARSISFRPAQIEALLARGGWAARLPVSDLRGFQNLAGLPQAFSDLREGLGYAADGGYRIYEADIRTGLAWAHLAAGDPTEARQEAVRARTMAQEMGYHWGQVDADEVLAEIDKTNSA
jgi:hypothetical protein